MSVNKVILIGNLGKDPEVRHLDNGRAVAKFTLATNERYKDKNGALQTQTEWHNISLWTPLAEIAEKYLKKGNQVYIEGKISTREYTDPKDNVQKRFTEIEGRSLTLLGGPNNAGSSGVETSYVEPQEASKLSPISSSAVEDGDLPF